MDKGGLGNLSTYILSLVRTYLPILVAICSWLYQGIAGYLMDTGGSGHLSTYILSLERIYLIILGWSCSFEYQETAGSLTETTGSGHLSMRMFSLERTYLLILVGICSWEYQGTAGQRDTYLEQQQTEKLETEVRDVDRIRITKVNACCQGWLSGGS